jgi:type I restriction enzyme S subunit
VNDWPVQPLRALAEVALGRQRAPQHEQGPHMVPYLRAANVSDGRINLNDVLEMNFSPNEQSTFGLRPGDILVTEGSGSLGTVGASAVWQGEISGVVCFQNTLLRLRPKDGRTDPRFLAWWSRATFADGVYASIASGANIFHLSAERVRALPLHSPPIDEQRRIADFLDAETARIDQLSGAISEGSNLLQARRQALLMSAFPQQRERVRLGYFLDLVTSGPRGWGDYVGDEGTPFFRSANLRRDSIDPNLENLASVEPPLSAAAEAARSRVRRGDVLIGITGANTGWVSLANQSIDGANVSQHVCLVRPGKKIDGRWLAYALSAPQVQELLLGSQYGGTKTQLSLGDIRDLVIPLPTVEGQQRIVADITEGLAAITAEHTLRQKQLTVLAERRQALVTAAVTGGITV